MKSRQELIESALNSVTQNVLDGIEMAREAGVSCDPPETIDVDLPLDGNGAPCSNGAVCESRLKTTIRI